MAIVCRCPEHAPSIRSNSYFDDNGCRRYTLPLGYPNTSSICGKNGCKEPGRIYLSNDEAIASDNIIGYPGREQTQVAVDGSITIECPPFE